jgi:O-antigen/teichoic acid export membrane protein
VSNQNETRNRNFNEIMMILLICLAVFVTLSALFYFLVKWAFHGDGYWPPGFLGVVLALILILGLPCAVIAFFKAVENKRPIYWCFPPLHNTRSYQSESIRH